MSSTPATASSSRATPSGTSSWHSTNDFLGSNTGLTAVEQLAQAMASCPPASIDNAFEAQFDLVDQVMQEHRQAMGPAPQFEWTMHAPTPRRSLGNYVEPIRQLDPTAEHFVPRTSVVLGISTHNVERQEPTRALNPAAGEFVPASYQVAHVVMPSTPRLRISRSKSPPPFTTEDVFSASSGPDIERCKSAAPMIVCSTASERCSPTTESVSDFTFDDSPTDFESCKLVPVFDPSSGYQAIPIFEFDFMIDSFIHVELPKVQPQNFKLNEGFDNWQPSDASAPSFVPKKRYAFSKACTGLKFGRVDEIQELEQVPIGVIQRQIIPKPNLDKLVSSPKASTCLEPTPVVNGRYIEPVITLLVEEDRPTLCDEETPCDTCMGLGHPPFPSEQTRCRVCWGEGCIRWSKRLNYTGPISSPRCEDDWKIDDGILHKEPQALITAPIQQRKRKEKFPGGSIGPKRGKKLSAAQNAVARGSSKQLPQNNQLAAVGKTREIEFSTKKITQQMSRKETLDKMAKPSNKQHGAQKTTTEGPSTQIPLNTQLAVVEESEGIKLPQKKVLRQLSRKETLEIMAEHSIKNPPKVWSLGGRARNAQPTKEPKTAEIDPSMEKVHIELEPICDTKPAVTMAHPTDEWTITKVIGVLHSVKTPLLCNTVLLIEWHKDGNDRFETSDTAPASKQLVLWKDPSRQLTSITSYWETLWIEDRDSTIRFIEPPQAQTLRTQKAPRLLGWHSATPHVPEARVLLDTTSAGIARHARNFSLPTPARGLIVALHRRAVTMSAIQLPSGRGALIFASRTNQVPPPQSLNHTLMLHHGSMQTSKTFVTATMTRASHHVHDMRQIAIIRYWAQCHPRALAVHLRSPSFNLPKDQTQPTKYRGRLARERRADTRYNMQENPCITLPHGVPEQVRENGSVEVAVVTLSSPKSPSTSNGKILSSQKSPRCEGRVAKVIAKAARLFSFSATIVHDASVAGGLHVCATTLDAVASGLHVEAEITQPSSAAIVLYEEPRSCFRRFIPGLGWMGLLKRKNNSEVPVSPPRKNSWTLGSFFRKGSSSGRFAGRGSKIV